MDPALKFVVDVQNSEQVKKLTTDINQQRDAIANLNRQLQAGAISQQQFDAAARPMGQAIARATGELGSLQTASGGAGRGLGQLSYAIDDIQYGFNAIVNNIPGIVMGFGGSVGVAGAVGIAAVAVNQLSKHWAELVDALSAAWSDTPVAQLEAVRAKAEEAAKAYEKLASTAPQAQGEQVAGVGKRLVEAGIENLTNLVAIRIGQDPNLAAKVESERPGFQMVGPGVVPRPVKSPEEAAKEEAAANYAKAKQMIGESQIAGPKGEAARLWLQKNMPPEIAQDLRLASPEGKAEAEQKRLDLAGGRNARKMQEKQEQKDLDEQGKLIEARHKIAQDNLKEDAERAKKAKKEDAERAKEAKTARIQALEDQRENLMKDRADATKRMHESTEKSQILSGPKAVVDMYQKAAAESKMDEARKKAEAQRDAMTKKLESIDQTLKKERRGPILRQ